MASDFESILARARPMEEERWGWLWRINCTEDNFLPSRLFEEVSLSPRTQGLPSVHKLAPVTGRLLTPTSPAHGFASTSSRDSDS